MSDVHVPDETDHEPMQETIAITIDKDDATLTVREDSDEITVLVQTGDTDAKAIKDEATSVLSLIMHTDRRLRIPYKMLGRTVFGIEVRSEGGKIQSRTCYPFESGWVDAKNMDGAIRNRIEKGREYEILKE